MSQRWTIVDQRDGTVLCACLVTPSEGSHPKFHGWAWDAATQDAKRIAAAPDLAIQRWSGSAWVEDPAKVGAMVEAAINAERETRQMAALTVGGAKKLVYARQQAEVLAWQSLGPVGAGVTTLVAAFNLLPETVRRQRFAFALASAARRRENSPAAAIDRFATGAVASTAEVARIEAIARAGIDAVRAATTAAAKRAVAIDWSWHPAS